METTAKIHIDKALDNLKVQGESQYRAGWTYPEHAKAEAQVAIAISLQSLVNVLEKIHDTMKEMKIY